MPFPIGAAMMAAATVASAAMGGSSKGTKVVQSRYIPPASEEERNLLSDLYNVARTGYYQPSSEFLSVLSKHYEPGADFVNILRRHYTPGQDFLNEISRRYEPTTQFVQEMQNPYLSLLPYQEKWGQFLNQVAARGVVNSTITQDAMKELGQTLAERGRELRWAGLQALEQARRYSLEDAFRKALAREEATRLSLADELRRASMLDVARRYALADELRRAAMREDAFRLSSDDRYNRLYRLWSSLYSGRMGTPTTVTERSGGPSMFSQVAGSAIGQALGYWLGPGGGLSRILKWKIGK